MIKTANAPARRSTFAFLVNRLRNWFSYHPEWWTAFLFMAAWIVLALDYFAGAGSTSNSHFIYCFNTGAATAAPVLTVPATGTVPVNTIFYLSNSIGPWLLMIVAMMFPLLKEPVRHVAYSVRSKDRHKAIIFFLSGYTLAWTFGGTILLSLAWWLNTLMAASSALMQTLLMVAGFVLAALLSWMPWRPVLLARCHQTMPISILGWPLITDSLQYGLKMGLTCFTICWAPMAALVMADHNLVLMYAVTIVLFYERYLLRHTSKLTGLAWMLIALILLGIQLWN